MSHFTFFFYFLIDIFFPVFHELHLPASVEGSLDAASSDPHFVSLLNSKAISPCSICYDRKCRLPRRRGHRHFLLFDKLDFF